MATKKVIKKAKAAKTAKKPAKAPKAKKAPAKRTKVVAEDVSSVVENDELVVEDSIEDPEAEAFFDQDDRADMDDSYINESEDE